MPKVAVIGAGYVGLVTAACLAKHGLQVICADNDINKINLLQKGKIPIYEPGLEPVLKECLNKKLCFTDDLKECIEEGEVIFITVGTPANSNGSTKIDFVLQVAEEIGTCLNGYKVIVSKSTVPIGTGKKIEKKIKEVLLKRKKDCRFDLVANPEFLREGTALNDFLNPDRIVVGASSDNAVTIMQEIYGSFIEKGIPFLVTEIETAEMIKYTANAFLAMKVTFINEIANLCEKVGADIFGVAKAIGLDRRISHHYLQPGPGYGGSCLPKDTRALVAIGREHGARVTLIEQVVKANERQKELMVHKIKEAMGELQNRTMAVLGITFKADTDDLREAPSLTILEQLAKMGMRLKVYDPQGQREGKRVFHKIMDQMAFFENVFAAVENADALMILTDWSEFGNLDLKMIKKSMSNYYFFDFRNIYERKLVEQHGFLYSGIGR